MVGVDEMKCRVSRFVSCRVSLQQMTTSAGMQVDSGSPIAVGFERIQPCYAENLCPTLRWASVASTLDNVSMQRTGIA